MRNTLRAACCAAALLAPGTAPALAQTSDDRIQKLEQRLDELERNHAEEIKSRDQEIERLRTQPDPVAAPATRPSDQSLLDEIDGVDAKPDGTVDTRSTAAPEDEPFSLRRTPVSFNPDIAIIGDFLGSFSTHRENDALNRADVREAELDLRAAIHPSADGVAVLAFARDVENPVFPDADEPPEGPESSVELEEIYVFFHDFGVPNLTAKLGRFHLRFGRQNMLHLHDLPTSDPSFVNQAFLAPESLTDAGLSLSYVIPPKLIGGQYVEVVGEVITGEGASSESPTLRGDLAADSPAFNTHILWNHDINSTWNVEVGASWLHGKASEDNALDVNLYGADFTLMRVDPTGGFFNQFFQAEAIYGDTYDEDGVHHNAWGLYALAQQQLHRDWYAGMRLDFTENPNDDQQESWGVSPYVSWYWSEFLRLRLQYQHKDGDVPSEDSIFLQATFMFGAHPPHPYWSMR